MAWYDETSFLADVRDAADQNHIVHECPVGCVCLLIVQPSGLPRTYSRRRMPCNRSSLRFISAMSACPAAFWKSEEGRQAACSVPL